MAADGRSAGPGKMGTVGKLDAQVDAYGALRSELMARMNNGASDAALVDWLNTMTQQKVYRIRASQTAPPRRRSHTRRRGYIC